MSNAIDLSQLNLRPIQEYMENRVKQVNYWTETVQETVSGGVSGAVNFGHRVARTGIGLGALAYDQATTSFSSGLEFVEKAEKKGESLEQSFTTRLGDRVQRLEEQAGVELRRVSTQLKSNPAVAGGKQVNAQLDRILAVIMPDNGAQADVNGAAIDPAEYDDKTVPELTALLKGMSVDEMLAMRAYESEHKARVTLLQAIDDEVKTGLSVE
jgi:hypothetical protein